MNKKTLTTLLVAILTITSINMVKANQPVPATVVILDTAVDSSMAVFKEKIVHEVCILEWNSCPNGKSFMEGQGSALLPSQFISKNGFEHGTKMAHSSILTNPNIKIVFVRIVGATSTGTRQPYNEKTIVNALNWVNENKDRFNIKAVALSQGHHNLGRVPNYCPSTPNTEGLISSLFARNVPVFVSAGNFRDQSRISWPACIIQSVAVSASTVSDGMALYSNYDKDRTDMFALSRLTVINPNGFTSVEEGTSVSAQVAASIYVGLNSLNPTYTATQILDLMKQKSTKLNHKTVTGFIVKKEALNG